MHRSKSQHTVERFTRQLMVGLYGLCYAFYFGLVALDSLYARWLRAELEAAVTDRIFTEISDFLLVVLAFLLLSGAAAFGAALKCPRALYPIMISWLLPVAVLGIVVVYGAGIETSGFGTAIRLSTAAIGSVLAMLAVGQFRPSEPTPPRRQRGPNALLPSS